MDEHPQTEVASTTQRKPDHDKPAEKPLRMVRGSQMLGTIPGPTWMIVAPHHHPTTQSALIGQPLGAWAYPAAQATPRPLPAVESLVSFDLDRPLYWQIPSKPNPWPNGLRCATFPVHCDPLHTKAPAALVQSGNKPKQPPSEHEDSMPLLAPRATKATCQTDQTALGSKNMSGRVKYYF